MTHPFHSARRRHHHPRRLLRQFRRRSPHHYPSRRLNPHHHHPHCRLLPPRPHPHKFRHQFKISILIYEKKASRFIIIMFNEIANVMLKYCKQKLESLI